MRFDLHPGALQLAMVSMPYKVMPTWQHSAIHRTCRDIDNPGADLA
jgi:hypothetical protein